MAETCFKCGHSLFVVTQGTLLAGRYEILEPLGKGGMGMVYKARDRELDEIVAIKVLCPEIARSGDMARRFRSEIKLARKIRHRNVCGIHEFGQDGHLQFIAMELIEGVDLKKVLRERGRLPIAEAYETTIQIAKGLQAIHDAGIVHRDLKTPNLMRDAQGFVRLMDFGIAKDVGATGAEQTVTGQIVGTPEYMSPEQARGQRVDYRSDIYALGVVVWELFTGNVPFRGDSPMVTLYKQLHDPPPLDGPEAVDLPEPIKPVLAKALAKDAHDRFQSVRELVEALRAARSASDITGTSGRVPVPVARVSGTDVTAAMRVRGPGGTAVMQVSGTDVTAAMPPNGGSTAPRPDLDDDDFDEPTAPQSPPTIAMAPAARTVPMRVAATKVLSTPSPARDRSQPAAAERPPSAVHRALPIVGFLTTITVSVLVWELARPGDDSKSAVTPSPTPVLTSAPTSPTVTAEPKAAPVASPVSSVVVAAAPRKSPPAAKPSPSPRIAESTNSGLITLPPARPATSPLPTPLPGSAATPAPTAPPLTDATVTPVPTAPPTPPPTPLPTTSVPPVWNSAPAVREALDAYVAAFVSLDPNSIKAVYPAISKAELERIRYFKAYDMEVDPGKIEISGKQARAEVSLKASIKSFTGKEHVLAPHQELFVLEYKNGAWVRIK